MVHGLDQMFIAEEVPNVDDVEVEIPEEVPEKRKVQQKITDYFSALWKINYILNFMYNTKIFPRKKIWISWDTLFMAFSEGKKT